MIAQGSLRPWMQTTLGHRFYFDDPREGVIAIRDIARALSRIPRFGGHGDRSLSVAEHSVAVSQLVETRGRRDLALAALLHDASEAYLCDLPTPHKSCGDMAGYREREAVTMSAIERTFRLPRGSTHDPAVKRADLDCLAAEARWTFAKLDAGWEAWLAGADAGCYVPSGCVASYAESLFMSRYIMLRGASS